MILLSLLAIAFLFVLACVLGYVSLWLILYGVFGSVWGSAGEGIPVSQRRTHTMTGSCTPEDLLVGRTTSMGDAENVTKSRPSLLAPGLALI